MNEPGAAVLPPHHPGIAMKPDDATIARDYPICGSQRLARKKHLGGFQAPALLIIGMNVLIPANRIFQPLLSRIAKGRFDLRAHICFADTSVEISHEDDRRYLLQECAIFGLKIRRLRIRIRSLPTFR